MSQYGGGPPPTQYATHPQSYPHQIPQQQYILQQAYQTPYPTASQPQHAYSASTAYQQQYAQAAPVGTYTQPPAAYPAYPAQAPPPVPPPPQHAGWSSPAAAGPISPPPVPSRPNPYERTVTYPGAPPATVWTPAHPQAQSVQSVQGGQISQPAAGSSLTKWAEYRKEQARLQQPVPAPPAPPAHSAVHSQYDQVLQPVPQHLRYAPPEPDWIGGQSPPSVHQNPGQYSPPAQPTQQYYPPPTQYGATQNAPVPGYAGYSQATQGPPTSPQANQYAGSPYPAQSGAGLTRKLSSWKDPRRGGVSAAPQAVQPGYPGSAPVAPVVSPPAGHGLSRRPSSWLDPRAGAAAQAAQASQQYGAAPVGYQPPPPTRPM